jgi:hypothetical protein
LRCTKFVEDANDNPGTIGSDDPRGNRVAHLPEAAYTSVVDIPCHGHIVGAWQLSRTSALSEQR